MTIPGSALVTGASRGLGAQIARRLAADGRPVAVNYRSDRAGAEKVVADIVAAGGRAAAFGADVTDEAEVGSLVAAVAAELGTIGVVVANATGPQPLAPAAEVTWQAHLDQLVFFVKSPTLLLQATLPGLRELGGGRFIHIGSDSFERALPGASPTTRPRAPRSAWPAPGRASSASTASRSTWWPRAGSRWNATGW